MKKLLIATMLMSACGVANAGTVSAGGGVTWEAADTSSTNNAGNFFTTIDFRQWFVKDTDTDGVGTYEDTAVSLAIGGSSTTGASFNNDAEWLVGVGELNLGTNAGQPLPGNYELTFEFGGIQVVDDPLLPGQKTFDGLSNGFLRVYLDRDFSDNEGGYDNTAAVSGDVMGAGYLEDAVDGDVWLELDFVSASYNAEFDPNTFSAPQNLGLWGNDMFNGFIGGDSDFGFQVDPASTALANENFDTDFAEYLGAIVDVIGFGLTSEFNAVYNSDSSGAYTGIRKINTYSDASSGNVEALTVSEPGTMALFGLGLLGLAGLARRQTKK